MLAAAVARADSVGVVTSLGGLGATDTIVWSQLGVDATTLPATPSFTSTHGLNGSVTLAGPNSLVAVVCPETLCSWNVAGTTGFATGDSLIWTADTGNSGNGPLTVNFTSTSVAGAGALIQADGPAQFTANIQAFNGATSLGTFPVTSDVSGDATFIGVLDSTGANISKVTFSITSCTGDCSDFAIDTVSLKVSSGPTPTPTATIAPTPTATATGATPTATATRTATPTATPTAVGPLLQITPPSKDFGTVKVHSTKKQTFVLTNEDSNSSITFQNPLATVSNFPIFAFPKKKATTCHQTLPPKGSCTLKLQFKPTSRGVPVFGTVTIFDNAGNANQSIPLSGTGK